MTEKLLSDVYNRAAASYDQSGPRFFSYFGRGLVERAGIRPGQHILDVATGRGAVLHPAARQVGPGGLAVGIDFSSAMLELQEAGMSQVCLLQMDASRLAFRAEAFEHIFCANAIFYFPEAAGEFYRLLRPGGQVGISSVASGSLDWNFEVMAPYLPKDEDSNEDQNIDEPAINTAEGLIRLLSRAGFEQVCVLEEEAAFEYADEAAWWSTLWSCGVRFQLERIPAQSLEQVKNDLYRKLADFRAGRRLVIPIRVLYAFGVRPG
jgi:SAM-dependent methyltransferase